MIHEGSPDQGHYYSYVYNRVKNIWYKFDEHIVSEIDESIVMEEALGNTLSNKSACQLFYVSSQVVDKIMNI